MTTTTARRLPQDPVWATRIDLEPVDATRYYTSDERTVASVTMKLAGCRTPGQPLDAGLQLAATYDDFLTPQQAREVARHLLELAEAAERG
ncbi:MAG: hypothetical protein M3P93_05525 [Actinomycetota bacterium]|nr:hypothetical protein [Actinomycetota bacterium]